MKKKDNLGSLCVLNVLKKITKTISGGNPKDSDYFPFVIVGVITGGYLIHRVEQSFECMYGGEFKVKTKDITILN